MRFEEPGLSTTQATSRTEADVGAPGRESGAAAVAPDASAVAAESPADAGTLVAVTQRGGIRWDLVVKVGVVLALGVALWLRFWTPSALWLDEALTVDIARAPLHQIPGLLADDGAPPLYYYLLH